MSDARVIPFNPDDRARGDGSNAGTPGATAPGAPGESTDPTPAADAAESSPPVETGLSEALRDAIGTRGRALDRKAAAALAFVRRRIAGDYEVDEFGCDPDLADSILLAPFRPLYDSWFRVEMRGQENIPAGAGLVVGNHSGTIPLDAVMTMLALRDHHPARRRLRPLGADLIFGLPFVGEYARKSGVTLACAPDAERLLNAGELVGVWPEGYKGIGKPFKDRYKLQRFGRGGFVAAALTTGAPIIPTAIVGAEETYPVLGNSKTLARILGVPYLPLTPTFPWLGPLGLVPLPSKWFIEFGTPIPTDHYPEGAADDPALVFDLADQVREVIQQTLYRLLMQRRSVFT